MFLKTVQMITVEIRVEFSVEKLNFSYHSNIHSFGDAEVISESPFPPLQRRTIKL